MGLPDSLTTPRLNLRGWRRRDAEARRAAIDASDAHLRPWIPFMGEEPRSLEQTRELLDQYHQEFRVDLHYRYAIWVHRSLVGEVLLIGGGAPQERELGYWLHHSHCGLGYMTEAASCVIQAASDCLGVRRLRVRCDERNRPSIAVAQRLGARFDTPERLADGVVLEHWVIELT